MQDLRAGVLQLTVLDGPGIRHYRPPPGPLPQISSRPICHSSAACFSSTQPDLGLFRKPPSDAASVPETERPSAPVTEQNGAAATDAAPRLSQSLRSGGVGQVKARTSFCRHWEYGVLSLLRAWCRYYTVRMSWHLLTHLTQRPHWVPFLTSAMEP